MSRNTPHIDRIDEVVPLCRVPVALPGPVDACVVVSFGSPGPSRRTHVKRTFQPNTHRRAKKHGFRARMSTRAGRSVLKARRLKGRARLSA